MSLMSRVPRSSGAAVTLVLLAATGCAAPMALEAPAAEPPPELADFYGQQIEFEPCAPYATCVR